MALQIISKTPKQIVLKGSVSPNDHVLIDYLTFIFKENYLQAVFFVNENHKWYKEFNQKLGEFGPFLDIEDNGRYVVNFDTPEKAIRLFNLIRGVSNLKIGVTDQTKKFIEDGFKNLNEPKSIIHKNIKIVSSYGQLFYQGPLEVLEVPNPLMAPIPQSENSLPLAEKEQLLLNGHRNKTRHGL